jgi:WD40 repeat protein
VWAVDGTPLATLPHDDQVVSAVFNPEGTRIVTASWDATARVWGTWSFDEALNEVRRRLGDGRFTDSECVQYRIDPCPAGS